MARSIGWFGLVVAAVLVAGNAAAFPQAGWSKPAYEVEVVVNGVPLREYTHDGRYFVEGSAGDRYALRVRNNTGSRVEVVASVDGLDVVDGKTGDYVHKRGYVIAPWQTYDIEGFRLDLGRVAAFRFSSVGDSYAAKKGDARNVGVIGVAFFAERPRPVYRPPQPIQAPREERWGANGPADGHAEAKSSGGSAKAAADAGGGFGGEGYGRVGGTAQAESTAAPAASAPRLESARRQAADETRARPGLGTEFGESRNSGVSETTFTRASFATPTSTVAVWYNDRAGLLAMGVPVDSPCPSEAWRRATANPFPASPHPNSFATPPAGWRED